jgi:uridine phosphorylase
LQESELILNPDGSIYHLAVLPEDVAKTIITVGDPNRVALVSSFFDTVDIKKSNREFVIHTGWLNNQRVTCLSTGMGTDNIDIVINELDALFNIDLNTRHILKAHTTLTIARIGTSGSINENIKVGNVLVTDVAIGLESLFDWYAIGSKSDNEKAWEALLSQIDLPIKPHVFESDRQLFEQFSKIYNPGVTLTTGGFYGPQNRMLRLSPRLNVIDSLAGLKTAKQGITNIEMETAGIYGLCQLLGHKAISINAIMANRVTGDFAKNPEEIMNTTIAQTLHLLCPS